MKKGIYVLPALLILIVLLTGCGGTVKQTIAPTKVENVTYIPAKNPVRVEGVKKVCILPFADYSHQQSLLVPEEWEANVKIIEEVTDQLIAHGLTVAVQEDVNTLLADYEGIKPIKKNYLLYGTTGEVESDDNEESPGTPEYEMKNETWGLDAQGELMSAMTVGLESPEDYETLPVLHNGFTTRWMNLALPGIVAFLAALVVAGFMIRWKGFYRIAGIAVAALSLAFIANSDPFRSSPFDPYSGDQGIAPWQLLIDDVRGKGGLTFWNHVETQSGVRDMGPIRVNTAPHPEVLDETSGYTGLAVLYGDTITITKPGGLWDRVLSDYCRGYREHPAWGIATAHYHKEGEAGEYIVIIRGNKYD